METKVDKKKKIQIGGYVVISYPATDMEALKECFSNFGTYSDAFNQIGISPNTIRNIMKTGKGAKRSVEKLLRYVEAYKEEQN